jgi:hypothetical protein
VLSRNAGQETAQRVSFAEDADFDDTVSVLRERGGADDNGRDFEQITK